MPPYPEAHGHKHSHSHSQKTPKKPGLRIPVSNVRWRVLLIIAGVLFVFIVGSFSYAANVEEHDSFCASCHTQPETDYYNRSQAQNPIDLASFHTTKQTRCIECHSGTGIFGRVSAIMLGAKNAAKFYTRTAIQPAPLTVPVRDENCLKCHASVFDSTDFNNHYHQFLPRWQAASPTAATCVDCHSAHATDGDAQIAFLSQTKTDQVCQNCHQTLGGGG
jgi:predicted CXXCH cytochrome family protein